MSLLDSRRYIAIAVVAALHVLLIEILANTPQTRDAPLEDTTTWSTLVSFPTKQAVRPPSRRTFSAPTIQVVTPAPIEEALTSIIAPPLPTPADSTSSVDWMSELKRTAVDATRLDESKRGAPGATIAGSESLPAPTMAHSAGEQYQLSTGQLIFWVSPRCFVISDHPEPGTPSSAAHMDLTRTQCNGDPGPRSDLLKDLPAYRRYHRDPSEVDADASAKVRSDGSP